MNESDNKVTQSGNRHLKAVDSSFDGLSQEVLKERLVKETVKSNALEEKVKDLALTLLELRNENETIK